MVLGMYFNEIAACGMLFIIVFTRTLFVILHRIYKHLKILFHGRESRIKTRPLQLHIQEQNNLKCHTYYGIKINDLPSLFSIRQELSSCNI